MPVIKSVWLSAVCPVRSWDIIVLLPVSKFFLQIQTGFYYRWRSVYVIGQSKCDVGIPSSHVTFLHLLPIHSQLPSTACIRMSIHFWVKVLQKQTTKGINIHSKGTVILLKNIRVPHPKNQGPSSFWLCLGRLVLWLHLGFLSL